MSARNDPLSVHLEAARRFDRGGGVLSDHIAQLDARRDRLQCRANARCACGCGGHRAAPSAASPSPQLAVTPSAASPPDTPSDAPAADDAPCNETSVAADGCDDAGFPLQVSLTDESLGNVARAPNSSSFYCVVEPEGDAHCAVARGADPLEDHERSQIKGQPLEPLYPSRQGTGHQQVARAAGLDFDEATARVGYVDGEGYGFSLYKEDDCHRDYGFRSAFNSKTNPDGSRMLAPERRARLRQQVEAAFPPCDLDDTQVP